VVGVHKGFWFYTIGQRQGIGLAGGPWYVVHKEVSTNTVYISRHYYDLNKARNQCVVGDIKWINEPMVSTDELHVKVRHGVQRYRCRVVQERDGLHLTLNVHDQGLAPGQFAVFYRGAECLGGGVITQTAESANKRDSQDKVPVVP